MERQGPGEGSGTPGSPSKHRNPFAATRLRRLLSGILPTLCLLVLAEIVLQIVRPSLLDNIRACTFRVRRDHARYITCHPDNFDPVTEQALLVFDETLFWRMRPNCTGTFFKTRNVETNSLGLRSIPPAKDKRANAVRLLFLGDSITFGYGVATGERYSERLAQLLGQRHPQVYWEVVNAGCVGYSSFQVGKTLRLLKDRVRPDCVFLCCGVNEGWLERVSDRDRARNLSTAGAQWHLRARSSQLFCAFEGFVAWARREAIAYKTHEKKAFSTWLYVPGQGSAASGALRVRSSVEEFEGNLEDAISGAHDSGARIVLINPATRGACPFPAEQYHASQLEQLAERSLLLASRHDLSVASLAAARTRGGLSEDEFFLDYCHPTAAGHRLLAEEILQCLEENEPVMRDLLARGAKP